jgi:sporulation protein YqfC
MKLKEKLAETLSLPKEILLSESRVILLGNSEVNIENYRGIIEYSSCVIRIKTENGKICVSGQDLEIIEITDEDLSIKGRVESIAID